MHPHLQLHFACTVLGDAESVISVASDGVHASGRPQRNHMVDAGHLLPPAAVVLDQRRFVEFE
jgi:hypothetical protein